MRRRVLRLLAEPPRDAVIRASRSVDQDDCPPGAPVQAPTAAAEALAAALGCRNIWLVEVWLDAASRHGVTVPPRLWTPLAELMATVRRIPRVVLGTALGPQGRWFCRRNPAWRDLVTPWPPPAAETRPTGDPPGAAGSVTALHAVLTTPGPWPPGMVDAALAEALSSPVGGTEGRRLGALLGRRLPLQAYGRLRTVAERLTGQPPRPGGSAVSLEVWSGLEAVLHQRGEIEVSFDPSAAVERYRLTRESGVGQPGVEERQ